jgi:hypothetical protein
VVLLSPALSPCLTFLSTLRLVLALTLLPPLQIVVLGVARRFTSLNVSYRKGGNGNVTAATAVIAQSTTSIVTSDLTTILAANSSTTTAAPEANTNNGGRDRMYDPDCDDSGNSMSNAPVVAKDAATGIAAAEAGDGGVMDAGVRVVSSGVAVSYCCGRRLCRCCNRCRSRSLC